MKALPWLAAVLLVACGGGGGGDGDGDPTSTTVVLRSQRTLTGMVYSFGEVNFDSLVPFTGDWGEFYAPTTRSRQLFAFGLESLPPDARITGVILQIHQVDVIGAPFAKLGDVVVDHVDYFAAPGPDSYDGQNLQRRIGTLSTSDSIGVRSVDVTAQVATDWEAGRLWSQFRLRFYSELAVFVDDENDLVRFAYSEMAGTTTNVAPALVVTYE